MNQADKERVFLATTALEEFWDTTKPIVFLGDWCLQYSRRNVWEPLNGEILQGIWKDKKRFLTYAFHDIFHGSFFKDGFRWISAPLPRRRGDYIH